MSARDASLITPADPILTLPVTIEQRVSTATLVIVGAFIAVSAIVLLVPFAIVAVHAVSHPAGLIATLAQPLAALQLGVALVVAFAFVAIPLRLLVQLSNQPRFITISTESVTSANGEWRESLASYKGVAHHIRTSFSGAQHEIVLVHAEPSKSVVLQTANRIAQDRIDAVAEMLNVSEVPARLMYERAAKSKRVSIKPCPEMTLGPALEAA